MNCFTIDRSQPFPGILVTKTGHVEVGEEGRGRKLVSVPVPEGSTIDSGRLVGVPARSAAEDSAVVLIKDHSGFRGSWTLYAARPAAEHDLIVARALVHRPPDGEGALAEGHKLLRGCAACDHEIGPIPKRNRENGCTVIAAGACAQGDAGRMGGGPEYLLVIPNGIAVEILRDGRLYGHPSVVKVANRDGQVTASFPKQDAEQRLASERW